VERLASDVLQEPAVGLQDGLVLRIEDVAGKLLFVAEQRLGVEF
jgi:hypothetical protein